MTQQAMGGVRADDSRVGEPHRTDPCLRVLSSAQRSLSATERPQRGTHGRPATPSRCPSDHRRYPSMPAKREHLPDRREPRMSRAQAGLMNGVGRAWPSRGRSSRARISTAKRRTWRGISRPNSAIWHMVACARQGGGRGRAATLGLSRRGAQLLVSQVLGGGLCDAA
jgi:hypothetical protein